MSRTIYAVYTNHSYEDSLLIRCYQLIKDAEKFASKCYKYEQTKPKMPEGDYEGAPKKWDDYWKLEEKWNSKHPGGVETAECLSDSFSVSPLKYYPAKRKTGR